MNRTQAREMWNCMFSPAGEHCYLDTQATGVVLGAGLPRLLHIHGGGKSSDEDRLCAKWLREFADALDKDTP